MGNMRQGPLLILLGLVVLFLLFTVLGKHNSSGINATDRDNLLADTVARIDSGQTKLHKATGKYTSELGTLTANDKTLARDLAIGSQILLSASDDGKAYVVQANNGQMVLVRSRTPSGVTNTCFDANTRSGNKCPVPADDLNQQIAAEKQAAQKAKQK